MTDVAPLVDAFHALDAEIRRLEARRELVRADLLAVLRGAPGVHRGARGAVRAGHLPTTRFRLGDVVERLDRARLLAEAARIDAVHLRRLLDADPAVERALASVVRRVDLPYVAALPGIPPR